MSNPPTAVTDDKTGERDYPYPPTGEMLRSVTTVRDSTIAKPWLPGWAAGLTAECAVDDIDYVTRLLAAEGRDAAVAYLKAKGERERGLKRDTGGFAHDTVERLIIWQASPEGTGAEVSLPLLPEHLAGADYDGLPLEEVADIMLDGFLNWASDWNPVFEAAEMTVYNYGLRYAGTLDLIAFLPGIAYGPAGRFVAGPGMRVCVDVKTGRDTGPVAEQVAAYRRCTECKPDRLSDELVPMPATDIGAVLHLRPEHRGGYRFIPVDPAEDALGWNMFRRSAELLAGRKEEKAKPGKVCRPPRPDGTVPQPYLDELDGEGYGRVLSPLIKAGYEGLEQVAAKTAGQLVATKGIGGKTVEGIRAMLADHGLHLAGEAPGMAEAAAA
jgi:hypothetical protein